MRFCAAGQFCPFLLVFLQLLARGCPPSRHHVPFFLGPQPPWRHRPLPPKRLRFRSPARADRPAACRDPQRFTLAGRHHRTRRRPPVFRAARLLQAGDLLVFNDTKVLHARLFGERPRAARWNCWLSGCCRGGNEVAVHLRVSKRNPQGAVMVLGGAAGVPRGLRATLLGRWPQDDGPLYHVRLENDAADDPTP